MSGGSELEIGSLVKVVGLKSKSELNGTYGVVKRFVEAQERFEVVPTRGKNTMAIKPENSDQSGIIQPRDADFQERRDFQHVVFWPRITSDGVIPIQAMDDWPAEVSNEINYTLSKNFVGKSP